MIVRMESEKNIIFEWAQYRSYISKTEGASPQADELGLEFMKRQVEKEILESESGNAEKMLDSQREYIEKMMEKIKEMTNIQSESIK
jgi:NAD(P)H-nitrite reductase large subunit